MFSHILNKADPKNVGYFQEQIARLDPLVKWSVKVELYKSKRSTEQNSRLWMLYKTIGDEIGYAADEIHELAGYKFLREQKLINGNSIEVIKSTTKLNTKEMADYQDAIERWAAEMGIYIE